MINYNIIPGLKERPKPEDIRSELFMLQSEHIMKVISKHFKMSIEQMIKTGRKREVVQARRITYYFLRKYTRLSLKNIGELVGGKDHTSVIHGLKSLKDLRWSDKDIDREISIIDNKL